MIRCGLCLLYILPLSCCYIVSFGCEFSDEGKALLKIKHRIVSDPYDALRSWQCDDVSFIQPCSWAGLKCSPEGRVISLNLADRCLNGTLAPEIGNLTHLKSIILRNNSFTGHIPKEIGNLKELEDLNLGYNNFIGPIPSEISNLFLTKLKISDILTPGSAGKGFSYVKGNDGNWKRGSRDLLHTSSSPSTSASPSRVPSTSPSPSPAPSPSSSPSLSPSSSSSPSPSSSLSPSPSSSPSPSPASSPSPSPSQAFSNSQSSPHSSSNNHTTVFLSAVGGGAGFLLISVIAAYCYTSSRATVKPWTTGLSGQLQKAFITGVPKLKRSELDAGCEDFSNVIGSSAIGTMYKGTLSNGVEIAVASVSITSSKEWYDYLEAQFRTKIETLSKLNHKNFVNLIGYCSEEKPFTRMMVFEYASNGSLFDHLHVTESEHLNWQTRLRIAMGMAYCLEQMHHLNPPMIHNNLTSSSIYLMEDYAVKISDFSFSYPTDVHSFSSGHPPTPEANVYSFGVLLFEILTGRLPFAIDSDTMDDWASDYLKCDKPITDMVDPTLETFHEDNLQSLWTLMTCCVQPDPLQRPLMSSVAATLRNISSITPDAAAPKLSPMWWAELEIMSPRSS